MRLLSYDIINFVFKPTPKIQSLQYDMTLVADTLVS